MDRKKQARAPEALMIPYGRQNIDQQDLDAVREVLTSNFLTQGPKVPQFEAAIAELTEAQHATACSSATAALHLAVLALNVGPGDIVWTTPITFVASANCARYCGADVDFVDIDPTTFNMCADALQEKLQEADRSGRLPKVLIPVHMAGQSPQMRRIAELARAYNVRIVEDASHAIGASHEGSPVGNCQYSDITVFSFHPVKIITTAEGGVATTNNPALHSKIQRLRSHGVTRDPAQMTQQSHGPWYYEQLELGWNYRLTELQAALGLSQLTRLALFVNRRNELANKYNHDLASLPVETPKVLSENRSSFHLYIILLDEGVAVKHKAVFEHLRASGIGVNLHYIPVHLQPYYAALGFKPGDFPKAEAYYRQAISLPLHPDLSTEEQNLVVQTLTTGLARSL